MMKRLLSAAGGAAPDKAAGCPLSAPVGVDLHVHSTFSDGAKTPQELALLAKKARLSFLALCDHDTADGFTQLKSALAESSIALIPGTEVSTGTSGSVHVLCYGENVLGAEMKAFLEGIARERVGRAEDMLRRLDEQGIRIPEEKRLALLKAPSVGRTHIARALIEAGVCHTIHQAFERYLGQGRPAYVPRKLLKTEDAVEKLASMNVVTVLAHPMRMGLEWTAMHAFIRSLKQRGLRGLEAYHPSAAARNARLLEQLARQEELLVTGGSDYHGDPASTAHIGRLPAGWHARKDDIHALYEAISDMTHTKGANDHV